MSVNEDISRFAGTYGDVNTGTNSFSYRPTTAWSTPMWPRFHHRHGRFRSAARHFGKEVVGKTDLVR